MIKRSRRRRDGWFSFLKMKRTPGISSSDFLSESEFALAVEKERCRSERRELSFCIALFDIENVPGEKTARDPGQSYRDLSACFRKRLRITDEIGMFRNAFSVLFPETMPGQAAAVINDLTGLAAEVGIAVSSEVFAYPDIDMDQRPPNEPGNNGVFEFDVDGSREFADAKDQPAGDERSSDGAVATANRPARQTVKNVASDPVRNKLRVQRLKTLIPTPKWKRAIDIAGASAGLVVLSPVFLGAAILVRVNSKGPAFFTQWREGKDGQLFKIYKFRTMRIGADDEKSAFRKLSEQDGPAFKLKDDPRLTSIGKYLRKTCVDELPQLVNVLKGEMSLVGPRPLPVDESLNCSTWHRRRLDVLPGMTCIWQVDGGRDIPFDDWMRMDLDYVRLRSVRTDLRLIFKTAFVTLLHRGSV